ncbi:MAG: GAF domain-containing protein [Candidatus Omnitrophica bacterium]|nr:GAF domain-containing protein [Candidatus Omnitrophota bacterium]
MDHRDAANSLSLLDVVGSQRWQRVQDHFSTVLGVAIRTVSPSHVLLAVPSWPPTLTPDRVINLLKVGEELESLLPLQDLPRTASSATTPLGVTYAAVPIQVPSDQLLAYVIIGPLIVGQREEELQFRQRASAMGVDPQSLWTLLLSLKLYTFSGVRSVLALLQEVGDSLVQLAYQAKQLGAIAPPLHRVDRAVVSYYSDRVLQSLLEAAVLATRADGGSVMLYDPHSETLNIQAAQGLSEAVIATTRVKRSEGIAGLAVTERSVLFVDAHTPDERVRARMARRELASSLVAPLTLEAQPEPIGVLNLRTADPQRRFTQDHAELLRRLLDLATVALSSLRATLTPASS